MVRLNRSLVAAVLLGSVSPALSGTMPKVVSVQAIAETEPVGTANDDAADDPAIWRNAQNPAKSLIVATDKKAGLYVYGLDGKVRSFLAGGRLNNVDLIDSGKGYVLVVASDRNDVTAAKLQLYKLDTETATLRGLGSVSGGTGEAYGVCLSRIGGAIHAFSVLKQGAIHQIRISLDLGAPRGETVRTLRLPTQTEGCVADARTKTLYVGEEDVGIWRFDADPNAPVAGQLIAPVDGSVLAADVEGLALAPIGARGGYLIASSQGDNSYTLYKLPSAKPAGKFRIVAGQFGATEETDGIAFATGDFGKRLRGGLFVAQDGSNAPAAQNFKIIRWRDVVKAIRSK